MKVKLSAIMVCLFLLASLKTLNSVSRAETTPALATVVVTNTANDGAGSLREAMTTANQTAGTTIQFNIPKTDPGFDGKVFIIRVESQLPAIGKDVTIIDGRTQTTATGDTNPAGPEIVIDGGLAPSNTNGFIFNSNSNQLRSLVINNFFGGAGVIISGAVKENLVAGCYIGTDELGTSAVDNQTGIRITGGAKTNKIGGSVDDGNVISGQLADGLVITGAGTDGNIVAGNLIGVDATSTRNLLPNLGEGVLISGGAKANVIGGADPKLINIIGGNLRNGVLVTGVGTSGNMIQGNLIGTIATGAARGNGQSGIAVVNGADTTTIGGPDAGNTIAFNAGNGVTIGAPNTAVVNKISISRNSIFSNGGLGIDIGNDGVTKNDTLDSDTGSNGLMNYPIITSVTAADGKVTVTGTIDSLAPDNTTVEIFANTLPSPGQDQSSFGEGQTYMASATPNAAGEFSATFTAPQNISVAATATDSLGSTSEFSAVFQLGGGQPDLLVADLTSDVSSTTAGSTIKLQFSIRNQGTSAASSARHDVVLSADSTLNGLDLTLASVTTSVLPPGTSQTFAVDVKIPSEGASGDLFVGVIADAGAVVVESQETNNTANVNLKVNQLPDLVVRNLNLSKSTVNPGDSLQVDFTVANLGSANALAHAQEVRLSTDNVIDASDTLLTSQSSSGITAGSTAQFVIDVRIPQTTTPGRYFIGVVADGRNAIAEINEVNNSASVAFTISGSIDFELSDLTVVPTTAGPGGQVALNFKLNNRGSLPAPATKLEIRLSNNQTIDSTDILLGSITSGAITAGGNATLSFNATLPADLPPGNRFIGVIADTGAEVAESNENNNTISAALSISDQDAPQVTVESPNGNETLISGSTFTIRWKSTDNGSVVTQDIFLSTDSGSSFNQVIVAGLSGTENSFLWNIPAGLNTGTARIQVVARDSQGNVGKDASDNNFAIGLRPILINPVLNSGKLKFTATGSNIQTGAILIVINGANRESFATTVNAGGTKFTVKKSAVSSPSGLSLSKAIPKGVIVQLLVRNPNGIESAPITFQR
jgi:subtilase family serine protease